jgi:hypothetical protein
MRPDGSWSPAGVTLVPSACDTLRLDLGEINLNLPGPRVALDQANLIIEAIGDSGILLGNLLCSVADLLNGGLLGWPVNNLLGAITELLNALLTL